MDKIEKFAESVRGTDKTAIKENADGGIGVEALAVSPSEHKEGEKHMLEIGGHDDPTLAEKRLEHTFAYGHGAIRERG